MLIQNSSFLIVYNKFFGKDNERLNETSLYRHDKKLYSLFCFLLSIYLEYTCNISDESEEISDISLKEC
jgi:hypothetical protein